MCVVLVSVRQKGFGCLFLLMSIQDQLWVLCLYAMYLILLVLYLIFAQHFFSYLSISLVSITFLFWHFSDTVGYHHHHHHIYLTSFEDKTRRTYLHNITVTHEDTNTA